MLIKKQYIKNNDDWKNAYGECLSVYTREQIDSLAERTIDNILRVTKKYGNIYSGYTAGKDSVVLNHLLMKSGITHTPIIWKGVNNWPDVEKWLKTHSPKNIETEIISKFDFDFLNAHPEYLFCPDRNIAQKWMGEKWRRYKTDLKKRNADLFITGRRFADGNLCGKRENDFIKRGETYSQYSPMALWTHEQLLAYIRYNGIKLSPFYSYPHGFMCGTIAMGEWTEYCCNKSQFETFKEVYSITPDTIISAGKYLKSAKKFLDKIHQKS